MFSGTYTISRASRTPTGRVVIEIVADPGLQRLAVMMPFAFTSAEEIDQTVRQALAGLDASPKPVHTSS